LTGVNVAQVRARGRTKIDPHQSMRGMSALFRFVFRLFLRFTQRHGLLERLTHFIQAFIVEVMNTLGAFSIEVDQLVVLAHGALCIA